MKGKTIACVSSRLRGEGEEGESRDSRLRVLDGSPPHLHGEKLRSHLCMTGIGSSFPLLPLGLKRKRKIEKKEGQSKALPRHRSRSGVKLPPSSLPFRMVLERRVTHDSIPFESGSSSIEDEDWLDAVEEKLVDPPEESEDVSSVEGSTFLVLHRSLEL